jgi:MFS family permease
MLLPYFLGNLLTKLITTPLLRRFGFWRILVTTACLNAVLLGAVALMPAPRAEPAVWTFAVLLFGAGVSRSMSMTGMATLTFADIAPERMTDANTLSAVFWQISQALGVALASLLLRAAVLSHGGTSVTAVDFRIALGALALICLITATVYTRMKRDAGAALTARA